MTRAEDFHRLERLERLAHRMDRAFRIPGTKVRFGWDSILGLLPGVGDTAALLPAGYILWTAYRMDVSPVTLALMVKNIGVDWFVGLFPLVGDILDVGYKSNTRNAALLRQEIEQRHYLPMKAA
jgi:hypothetical protein